MTDIQFFTAVNLVILFLNMVVLALTMKLYTELFKDKSMDKRQGVK